MTQSKHLLAIVILWCFVCGSPAVHAQSCKETDILVGDQCVDAGLASCALTGGGACSDNYNFGTNNTESSKRPVPVDAPPSTETSAAAASSQTSTTPPTPLFEGDVKLACEAILCLSTSSRPPECNPSITRFFSIVMKKFEDTLKARNDFLALCPSANANEGMSSLTNALANGAGQCDAEGLNRSQATPTGGDNAATAVIGNNLPSYCDALYSNPWVDLKDSKPMYVGDPNRGGYWVNPADYPAALESYNRRIKSEDEASANEGKY